MARPEDKDWEFLDRVIALMIHIQKCSDEIECTTDNLDVLRLAHIQMTDAKIVQMSAIEYRKRLERLKAIERQVKKLEKQIQELEKFKQQVEKGGFDYGFNPSN